MTYKEWKQKFLVEKDYDTVDGVVGSVVLAPHIVKVLESEFGKLNGDEVILREERLEHIRERHPEVADLVKEKYKEILNNPDYILKDSKNENTVWVIRDIKRYKNSIITGYKISESQFKRYIKKNKIILDNTKKTM